MKYMMTNLRRDHHLKHFGRLHLGLFLKSAGLTLDDSIKFWKKSFTPRYTDE